MLARLALLAREKPLLLAAWVSVVVLGLRFFGADFAYAFAHGDWTSGPGTLLGRDFVNVFTAGHLVLDGRLDVVFDVDAYREYQAQMFDGRVLAHNYSYPPVSFFYVPLFALGGYGLSYFLWIGLTGIAFVLAARPYLRDVGLPAWSALMIPAALVNVWAGHYGFLFGALWLAAWRLVEARPRTAGMLIGLMIVKPHLALLMPLVLLRRGAWTPIVYAAVTSLSLVVVSGLAFGWGYWVTYLTQTSVFQAAMVDAEGGFFMLMMPTILAAALQSGLEPILGWALQSLVAVLVMAALWTWMPRDPMKAGLATATATFLVLPYAFNYDLTVVGIAALIALKRTDYSATSVQRSTGLLAFLLPFVVINLNNAGLPLAPLVLGMLLVALLRDERVRKFAVSPPALANA